LLCGIGCRHNRSAQLGLATDISLEKKDELQRINSSNNGEIYHTYILRIEALLIAKFFVLTKKTQKSAYIERTF
jgi:hypothetical protein